MTPLPRKDGLQSTLSARVLLILIVICIAAGLRWRAVVLLPVDYDEDDYLRAGQQYAQGLRAGDRSVLIRENYRPEHPPLMKIVYGLALLTVPPGAEIPDRPVTASPNPDLPHQPLMAARTVSALLGVLEVALLALVSPLAGLFLAVHTFTIKYTSQVMLESLPALTSLAVIAAYLRFRRTRQLGWLALSALCLGLTAAAKYYYALVGVLALADLARTAHPLRRRRLALAAAYGLLALVIFFTANPYLWPDPVARLFESITYHAGYAQSEQVTSAVNPFWAPLTYLSIPVPWHPGVFLVRIDWMIFALALAGIPHARQRHPLYLAWLALGLGFLLVWPTKWPQYTLMLTAPLCILAADGLSQFSAELVQRWHNRSHRPSLHPQAGFAQLKPALPWLAPGAAALLIITAYPLLFQLAISLTDFQSTAIRDGVQGSVWREVWAGLSGQTKPRPVDVFSLGSAGNRVHYTGPGALLAVLFNLGDLYVFESVWTILAVTTQTALGVAAAMLFHRRRVWLASLWQAVLILPWAVPEFVAALAWSQIFEPRFGFLSLASKSWGQTAPEVARFAASWQENPNLALGVLLVAALWFGFPLMMLAARAGLKLIPEEVYDAAALDGAAGPALFRFITWPLILPVMLPAMILRAIYAFNQFYLFTTLRTPVITLSAASYFTFAEGAYAASAVLNIVTVVILAGFLAGFNHLTRPSQGASHA